MGPRPERQGWVETDEHGAMVALDIYDKNAEPPITS